MTGTKGSRKRLLAPLLAVAAETLLAGVALASPSPAALCQARKLVAVGKAASASGKCMAAITIGRPIVDCITRVRTAMMRGFEHAEARGGCLTSDDTSAIQDRIDAFVSDVSDALSPQGGTSSCTAGEFRAEGNKLRRDLDAYARDKRTPTRRA